MLSAIESIRGGNTEWLQITFKYFLIPGKISDVYNVRDHVGQLIKRQIWESRSSELQISETDISWKNKNPKWNCFSVMQQDLALENRASLHSVKFLFNLCENPVSVLL